MEKVVGVLGYVIVKYVPSRSFRIVFLMIYTICAYILTRLIEPYTERAFMEPIDHSFLIVILFYFFFMHDGAFTLIEYLRRNLFVILPVYRVEERDIGRVVMDVLWMIALGMGKRVVTGVLFFFLGVCADEESSEVFRMSWGVNMLYAVAVYGILLTMFSVNNFLCVIVQVVTLGKYRLYAQNNSPFFSVSIKEFWGKRYNLLAGGVLRENIFVPLLKRGYAPIIASMTTFAAIGVLHTWQSHIMFQGYELSTFLFFVVHGLCVSVEIVLGKYFGYYKLPRLIRWGITMSIIVATGPLFPGIFLHDWHRMNAVFPDLLIDHNLDPFLETIFTKASCIVL